jgi:iron transport multicopper oxidase
VERTKRGNLEPIRLPPPDQTFFYIYNQSRSHPFAHTTPYSLRMKFQVVTAALALAGLCSAQLAPIGKNDKYYNFTATWVNANPDGVHERRVIGINDQWPIPTINVTKGDRVIVDLYNDLGTQNVSLHWHGLFMEGQNAQDGPVWITQCPQSPEDSSFAFRYNFTVEQAGTYWYHSHVGGQYPDGLRGVFIVNDPEDPYKDEYDEHIWFTVSDWYHEEIPDLLPDFLSVYNPTGAEPIPSNILFNDTLNTTIKVEPGKTYKLSIINIGAFVSQYVEIMNHTMEVIEIDGVYTEKSDPIDLLYITSAQRYSVLLKTKDDASTNFPIMTTIDGTMLDLTPEDLVLYQTNWLQYNDDPNDRPEGPENYYWHTDKEGDGADDEFEERRFDDMDLVPLDGMKLLPDPDMTITVNVTMNNLNNGINYAFFNELTWVAPKVPVLYTVMSSPDGMETDATIYGDNTHTYVLKHNDVIDIVLNNEDAGTHPFHMHGRVFQVPYRSEAYEDDDMTPFDPEDEDIKFAEVPMRRDTVYVKPNGNMVMRFRADNPGVWFFHCHIEWHMEQGLAFTLVEAPEELKKQYVPPNHFDACKIAEVPTVGNAAGNDTDFLNLSGQNLQEKDLPAGFTARGIVALVFSCIAAFLGMGAVAWYGASDIKNQEIRMIQEFEREAGEEVDGAESLQDVQDEPVHIPHPHLHHNNATN